MFTDVQDLFENIEFVFIIHRPIQILFYWYFTFKNFLITHSGFLQCGHVFWTDLTFIPFGLSNETTVLHFNDKKELHCKTGPSRNKSKCLTSLAVFFNTGKYLPMG